jgi:hypothetical protein
MLVLLLKHQVLLLHLPLLQLMKRLVMEVVVDKQVMVLLHLLLCQNHHQPRPHRHHLQRITEPAALVMAVLEMKLLMVVV